MLQEYSTLSPHKPGAATAFIAAAGQLEAAWRGVNPAARVYLLETWARAACIAGVLPVGDAALRAVREDVADRDPYDGIDVGKANLWGDDSDHLSAWGSYLEALVLVGQPTGRDPASLGAANRAGRDLGLSAEQIKAAQAVALRQLRVPHAWYQRAATAWFTAPTMPRPTTMSDRPSSPTPWPCL